MDRFKRVLALCALVVGGTIASQGLHAQVPSNEVSLKVSRESAPPGAIAQAKVFITEPKPITTGRARLATGLSLIEGIALTNSSRDTAGVALVHGGDVQLNVVSPSATFAVDSDYPSLTVAGRVPAGTPLGTQIPMTIDAASLRLFDPSGTLYPVETKSGLLTVASGLSVSDVVPGSADLPAGSVVTVSGTGFQPATRVRFKEILLAHVRYVSPTRIDVVLAEPTRMHGVGVRVKNPDGQEVMYFSYQRTVRTGTTAHPVLRAAYPIFAQATSLAATLRLPSGTSGVAVQNRGTVDTIVLAELLAADGRPLAAAAFPLPANRYTVRSASEIFGFVHAGGVTVKLRALNPIQALGVEVTADGAAIPRLPQ